MASQRTKIINALVERVKQIPSAGTLGSVNPFVRHVATVKDRPSVDITLGNEKREQQPSFQAKRETEWFIFVWGETAATQATEDLCEEIENAIRDEPQFIVENGGTPLVTTTYSDGIDSDAGTLAQENLGVARVIHGTTRWHVTEN